MKLTIMEALLKFCQKEFISLSDIETYYDNQNYDTWESCLDKTRGIFFYVAFCWYGKQQHNKYWEAIAVAWYFYVDKLQKNKPTKRNPNIKTRKQADKEYTIGIVNLFGGNKTHAAKALGISLRALRYVCNTSDLDRLN